MEIGQAYTVHLIASNYIAFDSCHCLHFKRVMERGSPLHKLLCHKKWVEKPTWWLSSDIQSYRKNSERFGHLDGITRGSSGYFRNKNKTATKSRLFIIYPP